MKFPSAADRCAERMALKRKPCGVCARQRLWRGTVASMCWPLADCLIVSTTGSAGMAPGDCARACKTRSITSAGTSGRAASWISTWAGGDDPAASASSPSLTDA